MSYTDHAPLPNRANINSGLSFGHPATYEQILGSPRSPLTAACQPPTAESLKKHIVSANVGPFDVQGFDLAIESLKRIFAKVKVDKPDLYALLGTAGMLCCRLIRGSLHTPSNHSWGCAIDMKIGGELVPLGADYTLVGLLDLYPYFHAEGWYSGMGFHRPDSMHFEIADQTIRAWHAEGKI